MNDREKGKRVQMQNPIASLAVWYLKGKRVQKTITSLSRAVFFSPKTESLEFLVAVDTIAFIS